MNLSSRYLILLPLLCPVVSAQEQQPAPAAPAAAASVAQPVAPAAAPSKTQAPELFGVEFPLLDPASDTVSYKGGVFDVGNNAVVRARFEKYLQQNPDVSEVARKYRNKLEELVHVTQRNARSGKAVGGENMVKIGHGLYEMSEYPPDGGQSGALASAMASALAVQFANQKRDRENDKLQAEIDELVSHTNRLTNINTGRGKASASNTNTVRISRNTKKIAGHEAAQVKNDAESTAALALSKVNYQSMLVSLLLSRRFDHALIGANSYRHIFRDGDTSLKLEKDSQADKLFRNTAGMPPTINSIASAASTARRDVDQHMEAVNNLLEQNKLSDATQHLIEAVAVGEYMSSVSTFPTEKRRRIAEYWSLRRRVLTSLNARDYGTAEEIAKRMKELDRDFDDAMVMSYCAGKKQQSDLALRNAVKALQIGSR